MPEAMRGGVRQGYSEEELCWTSQNNPEHLETGCAMCPDQNHSQDHSQDGPGVAFAEDCLCHRSQQQLGFPARLHA